MKAVVLRDGAMVVDEIDELTPGPGQVLVEPIACGICGSDLHTVDHAHDLVQSAVDAGIPTFSFDPDADMVMGHELSVRVVGLGSGVDSVSEGDEMAAMPFLEIPEGRAVPGYDNRFPGGYSEQMLLSPAALLPIPNGLDPTIAALTEPMAVGLHAVNESAISAGRAAIVIGAGPVGLAIIASLAASGMGPIIVAEFSQARRELAVQMGAHIVVDPREQPAFDAWRAEVGADIAGAEPVPPVVYEAVGIPGMINELMRTAPNRSEILVAGLCLPPDSFRPSFGIYKHLNLKFVLGWSPEEFALSLHNLAEGRIDGSALITGEVDLDGVPQAFTDLASPEHHVKVMVKPNG